MADSYSRSPKLQKGALVELSEPFLGPVPNVIVFQYNPEKLTRTLKPWQAASQKTSATNGGAANNAQPYDPGESFSLRLEIDAADALEEGNPVTELSGVADRIAALEMLLYPVGDKGSVLGKAFGSLGGLSKGVPRGAVPVVLFVWGRGRIVPVRLTSFSVDEQFFSPALYPIHATVTVGLAVLTPESYTLAAVKQSTSVKLAIAAYKYTRGQKEILARLGLAKSAESILGMLPF